MSDGNSGAPAPQPQPAQIQPPVPTPTQPIPPQPRPPAPQSVSKLGSAYSHMIGKNQLVNTRENEIAHRQYVVFDFASVAQSLVPLYEPFFEKHKAIFARFTGPVSNYIAGNFARVYIAGCLHSIIEYNIEPFESLSIQAAVQTFGNARSDVPNFVKSTDGVDHFMAHLIESVRPTLIKSNGRQFMYIPDLRQTPREPQVMQQGFNIFLGFTNANCDINEAIFQNICYNMKESVKNFNVKLPSVTSKTGRPFWLFDTWNDLGGHNPVEIFSWFPFENNVNDDDVTMASILHCTMSPLLAEVDVSFEGILDNEPPGLDTHAGKMAVARPTPPHWEKHIVKRMIYGETAPTIIDDPAARAQALASASSGSVSGSKQSKKRRISGNLTTDTHVIAEKFRYYVMDYAYHVSVNRQVPGQVRSTMFGMIALK
uniref:Capsid n=1 Tax=viral metagenome TaxID=1070528 RepID=A0A2V0R9Z3_9ZZZZ